MKRIQLLIPLLAIIAVGCAGSRSNTSSGSGGTIAATVQMTGSHTFNPVNVTVAAGSTVQWQNTDTARHTVTSDTNVSALNSEQDGLPAGTTFNFTVPAGTASGTVFYYHCAFHGTAGNGTSLGSGMAGSVTVQ